ncbi:MAG: peroxiredoxin family protein [Jiangellaceae bacterium]
MSGKPSSTRQQRRSAQTHTTSSRQHNARRTWLIVPAVVLAIAAVAFAIVYATSGEPANSGDEVGYDVGDPRPGEQAPDFTLPATTGEQISLVDYRGSAVLLYFQEGLMCQPCWDQMRDLEQDIDAVRAAGVDEMLAITTDPIDLVTRKVHDDGLTTPTLSDPDLAVSRIYQTNLYGMMGDSRNGHSFILVGPDGTIQWRADYGGEPDYTMYVPVDDLLADLRAGRQP